MDQSKKQYRLFRIPHLESEGQENTVVGVLDASGSMSSYWNMLARQYNTLIAPQKNVFSITFDTSIKMKSTPELQENISAHGGGGTNISLPFDHLNIMLEQGWSSKIFLGQIKTENVTVIFVSDGADSYSSTLQQRLDDLQSNFLKLKNKKKINFLCVAVGKGFPTFIAMKLREIYHNGDTAASPVYLVDTSVQGDKEPLFLEQFSLLAPYIGHSAPVKIFPEAYRYPWAENAIKEVHCNSWVCSPQYDSLLVQGTKQEVEIQKLTNPNIHDLINIAKEWVSAIQLISLKQAAGAEAKIALEILNQMREELQAKRKDEKKKRETFADRVKLRGHNIEEDLNMLIREIRRFADNELLSKLSQEEAAKRLAIGTVVGKYHSNAVKLKGITVDDYLKARDQFIEVIQKNQVNLAKSSQEPSVISMQNLKDVLSEEDLIEGLKMCPSQYDLVETLPLIGHGVLVKRSEGALINPWMIRVQGLARHHKIIDTLAIQAKGNEIELQTGEGETEKINCVLPLFDDELDADLRPILMSKLFHILMTFTVMQNVDTCFETAYAALLANALVYLLGQDNTTWRNDTLDLIYKTSKFTYLQNKFFNEYLQALLENPATAVVTESAEIKTKCEDGSKAIYALFLAVRDPDSKLTKEQVKEIVHRIICEIVARSYHRETPITNYFEVANTEELDNLKLKFLARVEQLLQEYPKETLIQKYYYLQELKSDIQKKVDSLDLKSEANFQVKLKPSKLFFLSSNYNKFHLQKLQKISVYFTGEEISEDTLISYIYHADKYNNSYARSQNPINTNIEEILKEISQQKTYEVVKDNTIALDVFKALEPSYREQLYHVHEIVLPISEAELQAYCQQNNLDYAQYVFNKTSNLLTNACLALKCPQYLKLNQNFSQHLYSSGQNVPAFHKTIKMNPNLTPEQLCELILDGACIEKIDKAKSDIPKITEEMRKRFLEEIEKNLQAINESKKRYQAIG